MVERKVRKYLEPQMMLTVFESPNPSPGHAKFARLQAQKLNAGLPNTELMQTSMFPAVKKKKERKKHHSRCVLHILPRWRPCRLEARLSNMKHADCVHGCEYG